MSIFKMIQDSEESKEDIIAYQEKVINAMKINLDLSEKVIAKYKKMYEDAARELNMLRKHGSSLN